MTESGQKLDNSHFVSEWQKDPDIEVSCRPSVACGTSRSSQPNLPPPSLSSTISPSSNYNKNTIIQQAIEEEGVPVLLILLYTDVVLVFVALVFIAMCWKRKR